MDDDLTGAAGDPEPARSPEAPRERPLEGSIVEGPGASGASDGDAESRASRAVASRDADRVPVDTDDALPVVARLVVEIRSDGSRTVARGALEDNLTEQSVAVRAEGTTPLQLSLQLARSLATLPSLVRRQARLAIAARARDAGGSEAGDGPDDGGGPGGPRRSRIRRPRLRRTLRRLLRGGEGDEG